MLERLQVGAVIKPHGLKGEVIVFPMTDEIERFSALKEVLTADRPDAPRLQIENVKYFKGRPIIKFRGIDRVEDAEPLRGTELFVRREDAIPLEEGEYFIGDLVGCQVFQEDGTKLGVLKDVLQTGANDVYVVGALGRQDLLIPAVKDFVLEKDPENKRIVVRVLPEV